MLCDGGTGLELHILPGFGPYAMTYDELTPEEQRHFKDQIPPNRVLDKTGVVVDLDALRVGIDRSQLNDDGIYHAFENALRRQCQKEWTDGGCIGPVRIGGANVALLLSRRLKDLVGIPSFRLGVVGGRTTATFLRELKSHYQKMLPNGSLVFKTMKLCSKTVLPKFLCDHRRLPQNNIGEWFFFGVLLVHGCKFEDFAYGALQNNGLLGDGFVYDEAFEALAKKCCGPISDDIINNPSNIKTDTSHVPDEYIQLCPLSRSRALVGGEPAVVSIFRSLFKFSTLVWMFFDKALIDHTCAQDAVLKQRYDGWCTPSASTWSLRVVSKPDNEELLGEKYTVKVALCVGDLDTDTTTALLSDLPLSSTFNVSSVNSSVCASTADVRTRLLGMLPLELAVYFGDRRLNNPPVVSKRQFIDASNLECCIEFYPSNVSRKLTYRVESTLGRTVDGRPMSVTVGTYNVSVPVSTPPSLSIGSTPYVDVLSEREVLNKGMANGSTVVTQKQVSLSCPLSANLEVCESNSVECVKLGMRLDKIHYCPGGSSRATYTGVHFPHIVSIDSNDSHVHHVRSTTSFLLKATVTCNNQLVLNSDLKRVASAADPALVGDPTFVIRLLDATTKDDMSKTGFNTRNDATTRCVKCNNGLLVFMVHLRNQPSSYSSKQFVLQVAASDAVLACNPNWSTETKPFRILSGGGEFVPDGSHGDCWLPRGACYLRDGTPCAPVGKLDVSNFSMVRTLVCQMTEQMLLGDAKEGESRLQLENRRLKRKIADLQELVHRNGSQPSEIKAGGALTLQVSSKLFEHKTGFAAVAENNANIHVRILSGADTIDDKELAVQLFGSTRRVQFVVRVESCTESGYQFLTSQDRPLLRVHGDEGNRFVLDAGALNKIMYTKKISDMGTLRLHVCVFPDSKDGGVEYERAVTVQPGISQEFKTLTKKPHHNRSLLVDGALYK